VPDWPLYERNLTVRPQQSLKTYVWNRDPAQPGIPVSGKPEGGVDTAGH